MSLSATLKKAGYVAPLTLALAANAMAETKLPRIEPSSTDLSRPLTSDVCVATTPGQVGLTAWDKLKTIMSARGQMIATEGDQVVAGQNTRREKIVTISNNFSGKEGYIISSNEIHENRTQSSSFCIEPAKFAIAVNQKETPGVPKVLNQGQLGIALTNHDKAGDKVSVAGSYADGSLFAVIINPDTHKGALYMADATGNKAAAISALVDFDYSAKMKQVFSVASADKANGKPNIIASVSPEALLARTPQ